jgi:hypothetical protein
MALLASANDPERGRDVGGLLELLPPQSRGLSLERARAQMRVLILACGWCLALAAPTQAAPLASRTVTIELSAAPVELVAGGCGWGWHRNYYKTDRVCDQQTSGDHHFH